MSRQTFKSWSATRLHDYELCALAAYLKHTAKLCPICFDGSIKGGYDSPAVCSSGKGCKIEVGAPLVRGSRLDASIEKYIMGKGDLDKEIVNKQVLAIINKLKAAYKRKEVEAQLEIRLDANWKPVAHMFNGVWFRGKLDALWKTGEAWSAIDWKSGGIDKRTGKIRASNKYDDQLSLYSLATLSAFPKAEEVQGTLVFIDTPNHADPKVERPKTDLDRDGLEKAKKKWSLRVEPMMSDTIFAPKPSPDACRFCAYKKSAGGPCDFG